MKGNFSYFFREGSRNMFSHGFMSFAAIGITVACLLIMGTFSLVAYNANYNLKNLQKENAVLAFIDEDLTEDEARALVNNPSTIVADEPTGNLDPARSLEIMTLLERINALGTTVVVVTHEKSLVNHFDKRVIMIDHGVVAATGVGRYEVAAHA